MSVVDARLRIPPTVAALEQLSTGWRQELVSCRKFAPAARNYMVARLSPRMSVCGSTRRASSTSRMCGGSWAGSASSCPPRQGRPPKGPRQRAVPLINGAERALAWFIEEVLGWAIGQNVFQLARVDIELVDVDVISVLACVGGLVFVRQRGDLCGGCEADRRLVGGREVNERVDRVAAQLRADGLQGPGLELVVCRTSRDR